MNLRKFGATGLRIGPLGLGTVNFSWLTNEKDSFEVLDLAFERGVNFVDTANNYNAGQTEALIGRWFAQGDGRRERTVLATKVYAPPNEWGAEDPVRRSGSWVGPNQRGLSAKNIREACEASLKRLNTDYIDLYQMHHIDRAVRWEEIWQAMELLVTQGKILYVGSSNFAGWHIAQAQETAKARRFLGLTSEQSVYNLTERTIELEVLPVCRAYDMAFLPYSPLAGGALSGKRKRNELGRRSVAPLTKGGRKLEENELTLPASKTIEQFVALCARIGRDPADVALAWVAGRPGVTAPIIGPRTLEQFEKSLAAVEAPLANEVLGELDVLFPGPGGPAPEAYAW